MADRAEFAVDQWHRERPDLDALPMRLVGRLGEMAQVLGEAGAARSDTLVELVRLLTESDRRVLRHVLAVRAEVAGEPPRSRHGKRTIMPPGARSR